MCQCVRMCRCLRTPEASDPLQSEFQLAWPGCWKQNPHPLGEQLAASNCSANSRQLLCGGNWLTDILAIILKYEKMFLQCFHWNVTLSYEDNPGMSEKTDWKRTEYALSGKNAVATRYLSLLLIGISVIDWYIRECKHGVTTHSVSLLLIGWSHIFFG